jgi:hypothetical protein
MDRDAVMHRDVGGEQKTVVDDVIAVGVEEHRHPRRRDAADDCLAGIRRRRGPGDG